MAADHFLARSMNRLFDRPVLRFFTWNPYCISLGYHQKASDIDEFACRRRGIDLVRRPTGGRAILHAQELTYSVIYPFKSFNMEHFYRLVHLPFVEALSELGVPAEFEASQPDFRSIYKTDRAAACFATSARYEVEIDGRKLVGSAQRVYENAILQHGSILLGDLHLTLTDYLIMPDATRKKLSEYIRAHTATVREYNKEVTALELARKIRRKYEECFSIQFSSIDADNQLMKQLHAGLNPSEFSVFKNDPAEKSVLI